MENIKKVIITVQEKESFQRIKKVLPPEGIQITFERDVQKLVEHFEFDTCDLLILSSLSCKVSENTFTETFRFIKDKSPRTEIIYLVEGSELEEVIPALTIGSFQYVKLPIHDEELKLLISASLERAIQQTYIIRSDDENRMDRLGQLIGSSSVMQNVYELLQQAAQSPIPILILGETGTGKDLAAYEIHRMSERAKGPYVAVNLGALPGELVASELFGYEKGAFTGALSLYKGKFEQAGRGTIFLDEIDSIEEKVQVSLLRLIEENKFHRLGGKGTILNDTRLITASNQDLEELVNAGSFREDLFYRLDVFQIIMPPLHLRHGDISILAYDFLSRYNNSLRKNIMSISSGCLQALEAYDWPGNVRELKNVIQRAALICKGSELMIDDLPPRFLSARKQSPTITIEIGTHLSEIERKIILVSLESTGNNRTRAAKLLGISRRALYNKLRKYNIKSDIVKRKGLRPERME